MTCLRPFVLHRNHLHSTLQLPKAAVYSGGLTDDPEKCIVISGGEKKEAVAYHASHEEADDRMMFSIHQLYKKYTINKSYIKDSLSITVVTPEFDTDIFVVLMYNLKNTWKDLGLYLLKLQKKYRSCRTSDELRAKLYHHQSNNKRFVDLPCSSITLHKISEKRSYRLSCGLTRYS